MVISNLLIRRLNKNSSGNRLLCIFKFTIQKMKKHLEAEFWQIIKMMFWLEEVRTDAVKNYDSLCKIEENYIRSCNYQ